VVERRLVANGKSGFTSMSSGDFCRSFLPERIFAVRRSMSGTLQGGIKSGAVISGDMILAAKRVWSQVAAKSFPAERTSLCAKVFRNTYLRLVSNGAEELTELFRRHQNLLPSTGQDGEGCFVRRFEWHHDAAIGFKKQGHIRKRLADGDWFDGSSCGELIAFVGDECQWLIGGKLERVVLHLFPNGSDPWLRASLIAEIQR